MLLLVGMYAKPLSGALALCLALLAPAAAEDKNCLYAVSIGAKSTLPVCPDADPLGIGTNPRVLSAMNALGISTNDVAFRGCSRSPFSAVEDPRPNARPRFVVTYPSEETRFLAPITHELAHVMQIMRASGLNNLRATRSSIEIELSADFVVGYLFARNLSDLDKEQFQNNLSLVGAYVERAESAHGTPTQRTNAFRLGATNLYPYPNLTYARAMDYFLRNDLARTPAE